MEIFIGLTIVIVVAAVLAGIMQLLRQPIIIGHILTGLLVGPFLFGNAEITGSIDILSKFGVALLLFIIGLNLSPKVIKEVGRNSLSIGLIQVVLTSLAGFAVSRFLGLDNISSIYIGAALAFSSTIIIMKLISDKKDLGKLYSKVSIGLLLVQDLLISLILIGVTTYGKSGGSDWTVIALTLLKGVVVVDLVILFSSYILPWFMNYFAKSQELLFLFSMAWGLGLAALFHVLGFSIEIGALIAGVALSTSPFHFEISSKLRPLRDFFIVLFFVLLGSKISISSLAHNWIPVVVLSLFVLTVKPLIAIIVGLALGYKKRISFLAGNTLTQVSEFSIILLVAGVTYGHISESVLTIVTTVSMLTIAGSSYLIIFSDKIYKFFTPILGTMERSNPRELKTESKKYEVVMFGCNRTGQELLEVFKDEASKFLVVDYDPEMIAHLKAMGVETRYGDADDNEFLDEIGFENVKMVVSTIPDFDTNDFLIEKVNQINPKAIVIVVSHVVDEAIALYEAGATYVITPHLFGGKYASMLISKFGFDAEKFVQEKKKHLNDLEKRKDFGEMTMLPESMRR
ncbi:MAG: cation:proton antiporter [Candidatus Berkelbacteria bacterium]